MSTKQETKEKEVSDESEVTTPILSVDESLTVEQRLTNNAVENILPARYLKKDENGNIVETPAELFERVADNVATAEFLYSDDEETFEEWRDEFEYQMKTLRFIPNSPTLMNAGLPLQQLSACFVLEPGDSMTKPDENGRDSILDSVKSAGAIFKSGGGVGYSFHHLRPKGTLVSSTKGTSSGPLSFMRLFDETCNTVKQGGKRRGAQMAIMRVDHPDIGRFASSKREEGAFSNFNISVAVTDEFVDAVEDDEMYTLYAPSTDFEDAFEIVEATKNFYGPKEEEMPEAVVDENLWRDYADGIEAWDWDEGKTISFREKWQDYFEQAEENGSLDVGEPLELPARFIWDLMIDGAWRNGEPGLFYMDETNREHSFDVEERPEYEIQATNPSLVAGTPVLTDGGVKPIEQLDGKTFKTRTLSGEWAAASCRKSGENKELYEVQTNTGFTYEATPEHEWPVLSDGTVTKVRTDELNGGDWIPLTETDSLEYGNDGEYSDGLIIGWLYGDGSITERTEDDRADYQYSFTVSQEDANSGILDFLLDKLEEITGTRYNPTKRNRGGEDWYEIHACNPDIVQYMEQFDVSEKSYGIPDSIWSSGSEEFRRGFVDGLFSADGSVSESNDRVTLTTSRSQIAEDIVSLLSFYGIKAQRRESVTILGGKEYERHDVTISNTPAIRFRELFKFSHSGKQESLEKLSENKYETVKSTSVKITSVERLEKRADVWDITVLDKSHTFPIAGITTGNCAEQPLNNYEACNLGHINLSLMLEEDAPSFKEWRSQNEYEYDTTKAEVVDYVNEAIDFDDFDRTIESSTRFLDDVVDMSDFPLDEIEETVDNMRKIGLGVMGWAQMLYQMGIRYGSEESYIAGRHIMSYIDAHGTHESHKLAKERGSFDVWEDSKYANPTEYKEWFEAHAYKDAEDWEDGYPIRNHNITTIAPTGTTSMIADTSGGIEPVYNVAYKKNVGKDIQGDDMLVEFDSYFVKTLEENNLDVEEIKQIAADQMDSNEFEGVQGLPIPERLKEIFVTTNDLSSREHGLMQRAFQAGVDSGISKTVNLPKDATHNDVHEAYMLALSDDELGAPIKGLTVYRDQSRQEQVLTTQEYSDKDIEKAKELLQDAGFEVINDD